MSGGIIIVDGDIHLWMVRYKRMRSTKASLSPNPSSVARLWE